MSNFPTSTCARELQAYGWEDEIIEIADDASNDWMEIEAKGGRKIEVVNKEHIMRSNTRIETRKWIMARRVPKKYGAKIEAEIGPNTRQTVADLVRAAHEPGDG